MPLLAQTEIIYDEGFNLLLLVAFIGLIFSLQRIPYDIFSPDTINYAVIKEKYDINKKFLFFGFNVYLSFLIYKISKEIYSKGSIFEIFTNNRLDVGLGDDFLAGSFFPLFMNFFKHIYYIQLYMMFVNNKKFKFYFFYLIPMIHHQFTALTRFDFVIMFFVLVLIIIDSSVIKNFIDSYNKKRISTSKVILWVIPLFIFILFYMQTANYARSGLLSESNNSTLINTNVSYMAGSAVSDLNYYSAIYDLREFEKKNPKTKEYGLSWFYYPIINFIPRQLWPNKPLTSFSPRLTEIIYWKIGPGTPVATFTIFGEGYFQFGLIGVFISPFLFVYSRYYSIIYMKRFQGSKIVIYLTILSMVTYFRGEQPFFHVLSDIFFFKIIQFFFSKKITVSSFN